MIPRPQMKTAGVWLAAIATACLAPRVNGMDLKALDARAQAHFDMREYEQACVLWGQLLRQQPQTIKTHIKLGTALTRLKKYRDAEGAFRQALAVQPQSAMAQYHLGVLFMHEERYGPARQRLRRALRATPWYPNAHYLLGHMLEKEGRYAEAAEEYGKEVEVNASCYSAVQRLLSLQDEGKVGRGARGKVEWTPRKIVGLSLAMAIGLGIFVFAHIKTQSPEEMAVGRAPAK